MVINSTPIKQTIMLDKLDTAQNLGFIAKMNKLNRVPAKDQKFWNIIVDTPDIEEIANLYEAWLAGYDSCSQEYRNYRKQSKKVS